MERTRHPKQHRCHRTQRYRSPSPQALLETKGGPSDLLHSRHFAQAPPRGSNHGALVQAWLQNTEFPGQGFLEERRDLVGADRTRRTVREYRHPTSADSSIIAPVLSHKEHVSSHRMLHEPKRSKLRDERRHHMQTKKRRRSSQSLRSQSTDEPDQQKTTYEKRARHKTREDKYEPYHGGPARVKPVIATTSTEPVGSGLKKTEKSRGKKRGTGLTTTNELMGRFQSDAIHNERLTVSTGIIYWRCQER